MTQVVLLVVVAITTITATTAPQSTNFEPLVEELSGNDRPGEVNGDYEQIPYTTVQKFNGYEEREYPSLKWACTEETYPMEEATEDTSDWNLVKMIKEMMSKLGRKKKPSSKMFMRLFRYISGVNLQREKIEMTVPVLQKRTPHEDGTITNSMCFYLGKKHQDNPPEPEEAEVKIVDMKAMNVFVYMFGGYAMQDSVWAKEARAFEEKLKEDGREEELEFGSYFTAGYDSPMKFWNRRNEVMYLKKPTVV